jgi:glucose/arabinose dehydrogenase
MDAMHVQGCIRARWRGVVSPAGRTGLGGPLTLLASLLATCAFAAVASPVAGATKMSTTQVTLTVSKANNASPFNTARTLSVPSGWTAEVWARVTNARFAVWTPQSTLLVASAETGKVIQLTPGANMTAASQKVLISGLSAPQGLAFDTLEGTQYLYVAENDQVDRYVWTSSGTLGAHTVLIPNLAAGGSGDDVHSAKSIAIGPDHTIYVTLGSTSNATAPEPGESPPRGSILSFHSDGSHMQVFASGVRNGEGLSFAPDGTLWTAVNQRDEIPYPFHGPYGEFPEAFGHVISSYVNDHPPDEIARLTAGRNLGWPYCDPDPDKKPGNEKSRLQYANLAFDDDAATNPGGDVLNCATLEPIQRGIPAHSAPLGFHFLEGSAVRGRLSRGAVTAAHGSWDRSPPRAPAVLWLPWKAGKRTLGESTTLISGFQEASGSRWGRPADVVPGPDGALYVTDDTAGAVYRIAPPSG